MRLEPELKRKFSSMASLLATHVDEIAGRAVELILEGAPDYATEVPELVESVSAGARPSILAELVAMQRDATLPETCPKVDAEGARLAARFNVPIGLATWVYRVGHQVQWEAWFRAVERNERDPTRRRELIEAGSAFFFEYANRISNFVTEEYTRERDRMLRSREQRRVSLVRELLDGADIDAGALDYELDERWHLGIVAWGPAAAETIRDLARRLDRRLLAVEVADDAWWGWLGGSSPLDAGAVESLSRLDVPDGTRVTLGGEARHRAGFRRTHEEAANAYWVALGTEAAVTNFDDVALEVLAGADAERARAFVTRELTGLAGDDKRAVKLRGTLSAYFATGHNAAAAAARLGVHEQTVAQRLRAVEERTGRSVASRHTELETALRLRRYVLGAGAGSGGASPRETRQ